MSTDFTKMNTEELKKALREKQEGLLKTRFSLSGSRTRKTSEMRTLRREVSQILTQLNANK
jgi:ribosomal protein L29